MSVYVTDVIIDGDDDDSKRQLLYKKIDKFVDDKLTRNYQSFNDYLQNKNKNTNNNNKVNNSNKVHRHFESMIKQTNRTNRINSKYERQLARFKPGNEVTFKSHDSLMKEVKRNFDNCCYLDVITHMKYQNRQKLRRRKRLHIYENHDDSSSEEEDEEAQHLEYLESIIYQKKTDQKIGPLYWKIVKLIRYIRISGVHGTLLCLCYMAECKLKTAEFMRAVEDSDGIGLLLNLLGVQNIRCRIGALNILKELTSIMYYCRNITFLGGIQPLVDNLKDQNNDLQSLAAEILAKVAVFKRARTNIRRFDGISHLVYLLSIGHTKEMSKFVASTRVSIAQNESLRLSVTRSAATALWKVSKSRRNRICMRQAGIIPSLRALLHSEDHNILIPTIGILQQCASDLYYCVSIRTEHMLPLLIKHFQQRDVFLKTQIALTLFKCAVDTETRDQFRIMGGMKVLVDNFDVNCQQDLLYGLTGAIWKLCACSATCVQFISLNGVQKLLEIINNLPRTFSQYLRPQISASLNLNRLENSEKIITNVTGAIHEVSKLEKGRQIICGSESMAQFMELLKMEEEECLVNVIGTVGECCKHESCLSDIHALGGIQLLFQLTTTHSAKVIACCFNTLKSIIGNMPDSNSVIKSLIGCLELTLKHLESSDSAVLTATCSLIAEMGRSKENVAILTDLGVVRLLSRLLKTDHDDNLRAQLSNAIASCSDYKDNRKMFGHANIIPALVHFLRSSDPIVSEAAAKAIFHLSSDVGNSRTLNGIGVSHLLINMIGSENTELQLAAAGALGNMRKLGLETEKKLKTKKSKMKTK